MPLHRAHDLSLPRQQPHAPLPRHCTQTGLLRLWRSSNRLRPKNATPIMNCHSLGRNFMVLLTSPLPASFYRAYAVFLRPSHDGTNAKAVSAARRARKRGDQPPEGTTMPGMKTAVSPAWVLPL